MTLLLHEIEKPFIAGRNLPEPTIGSIVRERLVDSYLTRTRGANPTIAGLTGKLAAIAGKQLIQKSADISHPLNAYLIFQDDISMDGLAGICITVDGTTLYDRTDKPASPQLRRGPYSLCLAALGSDNLDDLREAYDLASGAANGTSVIAIEPEASDPQMHDILHGVFGEPEAGKFTTGPQGKRPSVSRLYGLA
jgi:hypothetical protein